MAKSRATAVSARSPPESMLSALGLLARRPGHDLDAGRGQVLRVGQAEAREAAAEELPESGVEGGLQRSERGAELSGDHAVELLDHGPRLGYGFDQIRPLRLEAVQAGPDRLVLFGREGIGAPSS